MKRRDLPLMMLLGLIVACAPVGLNYPRSDSSMPSHFGSLEGGITSYKALGGGWLENLRGRGFKPQ